MRSLVRSFEEANWDLGKGDFERLATLEKISTKFSVNGCMVNIFGFAGHDVTAVHPCCWHERSQMMGAAMFQ